LRAGTYNVAQMVLANDPAGFQLSHSASSLGDRLFGGS
jgi:hypothetical protein